MIKKLALIGCVVSAIPTMVQALPLPEITCAAAGLAGGVAAQNLIDSKSLYVSVPGILTVVACEVAIAGLLASWEATTGGRSLKGPLGSKYFKTNGAIALGTTGFTTALLLGLEYGVDKKKNKKVELHESCLQVTLKNKTA